MTYPHTCHTGPRSSICKASPSTIMLEGWAMASIYKEGAGYAARVRLNGKSAYKAGFKTQHVAKAWVRETETALLGNHQMMKGFGPMGTTLALAMRQHADDFLTTKKGAKPAITRMNAYFSASACQPCAQLPSNKRRQHPMGASKTATSTS